MGAELGDVPAIIWPLAVLLLIFKQYRSGMKTARAERNVAELIVRYT
jgi:hypothetical protein